MIASRPSTRALIAFPVGSAVIEGAIDLLVVVLAVQVLASDRVPRAFSARPSGPAG